MTETWTLTLLLSKEQAAKTMVPLSVCSLAQPDPLPNDSLRTLTCVVSFPDPAFTLDKGLARNLGLADSALPEIWRTNQITYTCWSRGKNRSPEKNTRKLQLAEFYGLLLS